MTDSCHEPSAPPGSEPRREARNTLWLEAYQIVVRVGWIFKTETIIMPAVLDAVVDSGLLRGMLPVLNRAGQSVPPLFASGLLAELPVKKWALVATSLMMAACFSAVLMLFPHYQAFARDRLGSHIGSLLTWVVVQNAATGAASLVAGPLSDRRGTRIVLIWLVALSSATPLLVTLLSLLPHGVAVEWFWIVYLPLGLNPISLKIFTN